ncbi:WD40/YVTN/BNR-like repeat-containing protein [Neptunomonas sp.]|uniref:WD40/YVTN/BNR-like repeat-containing protein n=1 Tax=Neptunomonas sp. TaxID=1971898 RepID=UPI0035652029
MLSFTKVFQRARWFVCCLSLAMTAWASAAADRIDTPSLLSSRASEGLLLDIAKAGDRLVVVGDYGRVLVSDDQGADWTQIQTPVSVLLTSVYFSDAWQGWAAGHDGVVIHTADGGDSWIRQLDGRQLNQLQLDTYQALVDAGGDSKTADLSLEDLELFLDDAMVAVEEGPTQPILDIYFINNQKGFVLGAYGLLLKTEDGGSSWVVLSHHVPNPDRFHLNALLVDKKVVNQQVAGQQTLIIAAEAGLLFRSDDQGESWVALDSPYEGSFFGLSSYQDQVLALGLRGHLFASQDHGDSWQQVALTRSASISGAATYNDEIMLVGQGGLVLHGRSLAQLKAFDVQDRRAWSSVVRVKDGWVLVGEKGIKRITDKVLEASYE